MTITRRTALAGLGTAALPRFAIAQADQRPELHVAVQKISNTLTLEPLHEQSSNVSERWVGSILETLIGRNQHHLLERQPGLAVAWRRINATTLELELRQGVRMHDGRVMSADDVAFSFGEGHAFGQGVPGDVAAVAQRHFPTLKALQTVGRTTVRFITEGPDLALEGRLSAGGAEIVSHAAWQQRGSWQANSLAPVGTGPYALESYAPGNKLVLRSHDDYWGGRPPLRRVTFHEVPEAAARVAGVGAGDFDIACDLTPDQAMLQLHGRRYAVKGGVVPNHRILAFDKTNPVLANPKVRLAMAHAIDCRQIADALWAHMTRVPHGLQFEFYGPMMIENWNVPAFDQPRARALLLEAGYRGEEIVYRVRHNYYTAELSTAQVLLEFWDQVGLNVKLEICENWSQVLAHKNRGVRDWSNSATFDDPVSSIVAQHGPHGAQQSNGEWTNEEMNRLCGRLESSFDPIERRRSFQRMLQICEREDPAYIVLHQTAVFNAVRDKLPWQPSPSFFLDFSQRGWLV